LSASLSQKKTLLVCDDDRLVLLSITTALRQAGYQVIETDNGDDAILLARQNRPDLAILDIAMDGKTGLDVAAYLRDYVSTPFMFLSAYGGDEAVDRGLSFGAVDYLVKPIETTRLLSRVEKVLSKLASQPAPVSVDAVAPAAPEGENVQHWVAAGILMERDSIELTEALRKLGELAKRNQQTLNQVALEVVASVDKSRIPGL